MSTPTPPNDPRLDGDIVDDSLTNPTSPSNVPATVPEPDAAVSSTENVPAPKSEADQEKLRRQLKAQDKKVSSSIATGAWAAIIVGAIALIVLIGMIEGTGTYFEAALLLAMVGFVSTIAYCKFLLRGDIVE